MAATYEPIATTTLGSAASSITFSSIPSTYTDLRVIITFTSTTGGYVLGMRFNSDTASNYSVTQLYGTGSSALSASTTGDTRIRLGDWNNLGSSTTIPAFVDVSVFSYTGSTYKTVLAQSSEDRNGSGTVTSGVGLWRSTSAINTINLYVSGTGNTLKTGTTATLYGILKA